MTVMIQRATRADRDALVSLERQLFPSDAWSPDVFGDELSHPDSFYLVARRHEESDPIAYGGLRAPHLPGGQGDIQTLAVAPDFRRQGIAREILLALLSEASSRGVSEVFLEVRADNQPARALYESEGFREIARRPGYYQPGSVDAVVMKKKLGKGGGHRE